MWGPGGVRGPPRARVRCPHLPMSEILKCSEMGAISRQDRKIPTLHDTSCHKTRNPGTFHPVRSFSSYNNPLFGGSKLTLSFFVRRLFQNQKLGLINILFDTRKFNDHFLLLSFKPIFIFTLHAVHCFKFRSQLFFKSAPLTLLFIPHGFVFIIIKSSSRFMHEVRGSIYFAEQMFSRAVKQPTQNVHNHKISGIQYN